MNDEHLAEEIKNSNILLPQDVDFIVTRSSDSFSKQVNITYRWPRKIDGSTISLIATTSLDVSKLTGLRVEEIDGQHFVINDPTSKFGDQTKLTVMSEEIGHRIIKAIIDEYTPPIEDNTSKQDTPKDDLELSKKYWRLNKIAEEFAPLIFTACAVLLSLSATFWLIFK